MASLTSALATHINPGDRVLYAGRRPHRFFQSSAHRAGSGYMTELASARSVSRLTSPDLDALDGRFDALGGSSFFTLIAIDAIADVLSSHELTTWRATISRLLAPGGRVAVGLRSVWYDSAIQPLDYGALADVIELDRLHNPLLTADRLRPSGYVVSSTRDAGWTGIIATLAPSRPHTLHIDGQARPTLVGQTGDSYTTSTNDCR